MGRAKNLAPNAKHARSLRATFVSFRGEENLVSFPTRASLSCGSRDFRRDECRRETRDLTRENCHSTCFFSDGEGRTGTPAGHSPWLRSQAISFFADFGRRRRARGKNPRTRDYAFKLLHDSDHVRVFRETTRIGRLIRGDHQLKLIAGSL